MLRRMPLTEDIITSRYRITGYEDDAIIINDIHHSNSLVVSAGFLQEWPVDSVDDLNNDNLSLIFNLNPEVVLLGTGKHQKFPEPKILALFGQKSLGVEVMDNGALCRTFNILIAEGRSVVAGIIQ